MKRKKCCLGLVAILLLTSIISSQTTISNEEKTSILQNSPPEFLDRSVTSVNTQISFHNPLGKMFQHFNTTVTTITKFEVKLSRTGMTEQGYIVIGLLRDIEDEDNEMVRYKFIPYEDIGESPSWHSCVFNDPDSEDENKQPYVHDYTCDLMILVGFWGATIVGDMEVHWAYAD